MNPLIVQPPARPACRGADPGLFEDNGPDTALEVIAKYCRPCKARLWCLQVTDPRNSAMPGIAGGVLWRKGLAVPLGLPWTPPPQLAEYLDQCAEPAQQR